MRSALSAFGPPRIKVVYNRNGESLRFAGIFFHSKESLERCMAARPCLDGSPISLRPARPTDARWFGKRRGGGNSGSVTAQVQRTRQVPTLPRSPLDRLGETAFADHVWATIDFEVACNAGANARAFPTEVGACLVSLRRGELGSFHRFIDPGPLPLGRSSTAAYVERHVTGIPYAGFDRATGDYAQLWSDLLAFLRSVPGAQPTLYANGPALENQCLQDLMRRARASEALGSVREIEELVIRVHALCGAPLTVADLEKHVAVCRASPHRALRCEFHASGDLGHHCALEDSRLAACAVLRAACQLEERRTLDTPGCARLVLAAAGDGADLARVVRDPQLSGDWDAAPGDSDTWQETAPPWPADTQPGKAWGDALNQSSAWGAAADQQSAWGGRATESQSGNTRSSSPKADRTWGGWAGSQSGNTRSSPRADPWGTADAW